MTDDHTDNEISVELVDTSRPSDSIETDREDSHQLYQHENRISVVKLVDTSRPSDSIETDREDSHQLYQHENRISVVKLVDTSRPSDSIETDREDSHQLYQHENKDHIDTSPTRDILEKEHVRCTTSRHTDSGSNDRQRHRRRI